MDFMELAKNRFAVRKFSDKPLEKEKLDLILEAGRLAPTAKNFQPQRIYVLQSEEALRKMNALSPCVYGAKTVLVFTYNEEEEWKNAQEAGIHSGVEDVSIVATHMMLAAASLGVDTIWCNRFANTQLEVTFNLPEEERAVLFMPIGYRAEGVQPGPLHEASKKIEDMVTYL